jgi:protein-tyrosine phosphatase
VTTGGLPSAPPFRLLFVCTGNICRSAAAERLARQVIGELPGGRTAAIEVGSAGTRAVVDGAMHPFSAGVVRNHGGCPDDFAARQLRPAMVAEADLVLTMTREHRRVVLGMEPRALSRTFTLREAADLARMVEATDGSDGGAAEAPARTLVQRMALARSQRRSDATDDVLDPIDHPAEVHHEVGEQIAELLHQLLLRLLVCDLAARELLAGRHSA